MSLSRRTFLAGGAGLAIAAALPRAAWASLSIYTTRYGDVTVLSLNGIVALGNGDAALRQAVQQNVDAGNTKIVLDLGGVRYMDESGVGEMASAYTAVTNRGGRLGLVNLPTSISEILTVTQLITVFEIYDSVNQAVMALKP